jgi:hypothetical protein
MFYSSHKNLRKKNFSYESENEVKIHGFVFVVLYNETGGYKEMSSILADQ